MLGEKENILEKVEIIHHQGGAGANTLIQPLTHGEENWISLTRKKVRLGVLQ